MAPKFDNSIIRFTLVPFDPTNHTSNSDPIPPLESPAVLSYRTEAR